MFPLCPAVAKHFMSFDDNWRNLAHAIEHEFTAQACLLPSVVDSTNINLSWAEGVINVALEDWD
jgi:hypothetical protein